eukprot:31107-Eustigmatos_ZCMA.PRE.1
MAARARQPGGGPMASFVPSGSWALVKTRLSFCTRIFGDKSALSPGGSQENGGIDSPVWRFPRSTLPRCDLLDLV